jgi:GT2 family glycosyltransferase
LTAEAHAVVVAYGNADQLDACLAGLERAIPVTVVDNSNSDAVKVVADRHHADYVGTGVNLGFGAGANVALRRLGRNPPEAVLLLNPDAVLNPNDLRMLAEYLNEVRNRRVAAVSPRLLGPDGTGQRVVWPYPTPWRAWAEAFGMGRRIPSHATFVIGAVLLLRWDAVREVGWFDEQFFLYAEETDWQRRADALGWTSALHSTAIARHTGAGTSACGLRREALFHAAQETYIRKWYGTSGWCVYRCATGFGAIARVLLLSGERRAEAKRRALLYLRGPRRCAAARRH